MMVADDNSDQGQEYSGLDKIQSAASAGVSHGQHITVEIEKNIALMRERLTGKVHLDGISRDNSP